MSKPLPSNHFFDEELQVWHKRPFWRSWVKTTYSVQPLSFRPSSNVENFYHDSAFVEDCLKHTRVTAKIKGSSLQFDGFLREQKRGRKKVKSATQLFQVLQVLLPFFLAKTCVVKCLDSR